MKQWLCGLLHGHPSRETTAVSNNGFSVLTTKFHSRCLRCSKVLR